MVTPLHVLLEQHAPADAQERLDLARMRAALGSLPQPLSRSQWPEHFTGSAVVVDPTGEKVCLVLHRRLQRWLQPGGHCEPADGGDLLATALREAAEETGLKVRLHPRRSAVLDLDAHLIPLRAAEPAHHHLDVRFLLLADDPAALRYDPAESTGAQWLSFDKALAAATEPAMRRMLLKAKAAVQPARS